MDKEESRHSSDKHLKWNRKIRNLLVFSGEKKRLLCLKQSVWTLKELFRCFCSPPELLLKKFHLKMRRKTNSVILQNIFISVVCFLKLLFVGDRTSVVEMLHIADTNWSIWLENDELAVRQRKSETVNFDIN